MYSIEIITQAITHELFKIESFNSFKDKHYYMRSLTPEAFNYIIIAKLTNDNVLSRRIKCASKYDTCTEYYRFKNIIRKLTFDNYNKTKIKII